MPPRAYRSASRILLDVLREIARRGPIATTPLIAAANLTHARLLANLEELTTRGWVENRDGWRLTEAGHAALRKLEEIETAMQDFGLAL
jgi:predicted transcriptional regulator